MRFCEKENNVNYMYVWEFWKFYEYDKDEWSKQVHRVKVLMKCLRNSEDRIRSRSGLHFKISESVYKSSSEWVKYYFR